MASRSDWWRHVEGAKVARNIASGLALGAEYYAEHGKVNNILPRREQAHTLYFALD